MTYEGRGKLEVEKNSKLKKNGRLQSIGRLDD